MTEPVGKTVVVTGAAGAIGRAIVTAFAPTGGRLIAVDVDGERLAHLPPLHPEPETVVADVTTESGVAAILELAEGQVDVLVNNAGVSDGIALIDEVDVETWRRSLEVNLTAPFLLCRGVIPGMLERGGGSIVNVASTAGLRGGRGGIAYTASKWGLVGLSENIAATLGHRGIRCNAICPGNTGTGMGDRGRLSERAQNVLSRDRDKPAPGTPEQIAAVVVFLASDESSRINGVALPVDGGWIAY